MAHRGGGGGGGGGGTTGDPLLQRLSRAQQQHLYQQQQQQHHHHHQQRQLQQQRPQRSPHNSQTMPEIAAARRTTGSPLQTAMPETTADRGGIDDGGDDGPEFRHYMAKLDPPSPYAGGRRSTTAKSRRLKRRRRPTTTSGASSTTTTTATGGGGSGLAQRPASSTVVVLSPLARTTVQMGVKPGSSTSTSSSRHSHSSGSSRRRPRGQTPSLPSTAEGGVRRRQHTASSSSSSNGGGSRGSTAPGRDLVRGGGLADGHVRPVHTPPADWGFAQAGMGFGMLGVPPTQLSPEKAVAESAVEAGARALLLIHSSPPATAQDFDREYFDRDPNNKNNTLDAHTEGGLDAGTSSTSLPSTRAGIRGISGSRQSPPSNSDSVVPAGGSALSGGSSFLPPPSSFPLQRHRDRPATSDGSTHKTDGKGLILISSALQRALIRAAGTDRPTSCPGDAPGRVHRDYFGLDNPEDNLDNTFSDTSSTLSSRLSLSAHSLLRGSRASSRQSRFRSSRPSTGHTSMSSTTEQSHAATIVQSLVRMKQARDWVWDPRGGLAANRAQTRISAAWRGYIQRHRKRIELRMARRAAAVRIQAIYRGQQGRFHAADRRIKRKANALLCVQLAWRAAIARRVVQRRRHAVRNARSVRIQSLWRGHVVRWVAKPNAKRSRKVRRAVQKGSQKKCWNEEQERRASLKKKEAQARNQRRAQKAQAEREKKMAAAEAAGLTRGRRGGDRSVRRKASSSGGSRWNIVKSQFGSSNRSPGRGQNRKNVDKTLIAPVVTWRVLREALLAHACVFVHHDVVKPPAAMAPAPIHSRTLPRNTLRERDARKVFAAHLQYVLGQCCHTAPGVGTSAKREAALMDAFSFAVSALCFRLSGGAEENARDVGRSDPVDDAELGRCLALLHDVTSALRLRRERARRARRASALAARKAAREKRRQWEQQRALFARGSPQPSRRGGTLAEKKKKKKNEEDSPQRATTHKMSPKRRASSAVPVVRKDEVGTLPFGHVIRDFYHVSVLTRPWDTARLRLLCFGLALGNETGLRDNDGVDADDVTTDEDADAVSSAEEPSSEDEDEEASGERREGRAEARCVRRQALQTRRQARRHARADRRRMRLGRLVVRCVQGAEAATRFRQEARAKAVRLAKAQAAEREHLEFQARLGGGDGRLGGSLVVASARRTRQHALSDEQDGEATENGGAKEAAEERELRLCRRMRDLVAGYFCARREGCGEGPQADITTGARCRVARRGNWIVVDGYIDRNVSTGAFTNQEENEAERAAGEEDLSGITLVQSYVLSVDECERVLGITVGRRRPAPAPPPTPTRRGKSSRRRKRSKKKKMTPLQPLTARSATREMTRPSDEVLSPLTPDEETALLEAIMPHIRVVRGDAPSTPLVVPADGTDEADSGVTAAPLPARMRLIVVPVERRRVQLERARRRQRAAVTIQRCYKGRILLNAMRRRVMLHRRSWAAHKQNLGAVLAKHKAAHDHHMKLVSKVKAAFIARRQRKQLRGMHKAAEKIQVVMRDYLAWLREEEAKAWAKYGAQIRTMYNRCRIVSGKAIVVRVQRAGKNWMLRGIDYECGEVYQGLVKEQQVLRLIKKHRYGRDQGYTLKRRARIYVWEHQRVLLLLLSCLAITDAIDGLGELHRFDGGRILVCDPEFEDKASGPSILSRVGQGRVLEDTKDCLPPDEDGPPEDHRAGAES